jgi:hypothetical protein
MRAGAPSTKPAPARGWAKVFGFPKDPRSYGEYVKRASPDGRYRLVFEPGLEYAMMRYAHQFRLVDAGKELVEEFRGLTSPAQMAWWSPDSRVVAIPVSGLLLYAVQRRRYALVPFDIFQNDVALGVAGIRLSVNRQQFAATFGEEFEPPRPVSLRFAALRWFPVPERGPWKLGAALRSAPKLRWLPPPSTSLRASAKAHGIILPRG